MMGPSGVWRWVFGVRARRPGAADHRPPTTDPLLFWAMAAVTALMVCVAATFKEYSPDVPLHLKLGEI
ncbi:MAG: hypothetical protein FJ272_03915, partial [Planctomycetes bacterium]|nr:hypothetical protein [Planctomycetota bacterium]